MLTVFVSQLVDRRPPHRVSELSFADLKPTKRKITKEKLLLQIRRPVAIQLTLYKVSCFLVVC
uniref:Uncharacterized protein n=1 Tax=Glycine max TaxID=3847 RepID=C6TER1_SOYBN|nr:unknown [Glycine max]